MELTRNYTSFEPAPIALFVFRRLLHTRAAVEALKQNELASQSNLYVFCDGPRSDADVFDVRAVRSYVRDITGFSSIEIVEREHNLGLATSIISGVSDVVSRHGRVIVVEDDLITSRYFLRYMNSGLSIYQNELRVACVHGYMYPVERELPETFFLRGADCWGWATWKRAWDKFEPDPHVLLERLSCNNLAHRFDLDGSYGFTAMLQDFADGKNNSWAVRWHASMFLENMLTLYPQRSLVQNIGFDDSGTHCGVSTGYDVALGRQTVHVAPVLIEESDAARDAVAAFFRRMVSDASVPKEDAKPAPAVEMVSQVPKSSNSTSQISKVRWPKLNSMKVYLLDYINRFLASQKAVEQLEPFSDTATPPKIVTASVDQRDDFSGQSFFSLNELDRKLRSRISHRGGFYVELGANDGVNQSNTLHFEKELGWKGILVEPIPHRYLECVRNRSKENKIFCNACVSDEYSDEFVKIIYSNLMSIAPSLNLDISDPVAHAQLGAQFLPPEERLFTFGAVARTLTSILQEANAPHYIDLLSLDVEGAEYEILKGLNFSIYSFGFILIESRRVERIAEILGAFGYNLIDKFSEHDYLFEMAR